MLLGDLLDLGPLVVLFGNLLYLFPVFGYNIVLTWIYILAHVKAAPVIS